ncbi:MAG: hypothetical protein LUF90_06740 [Rikenellaceae bacterium]|nr:hypothetical protein [Rikenellaceae bacterium]
MEKQYFIGPDKLFGILYSPDESLNKEKSVLMVHPFAEEKKSSQRILVQISQYLSSLGYTVLLFDLSGCGDSHGNFSDISMDQWLKDISNAQNFLDEKIGVQLTNIIGVRFGAYLSLIFNQVNGGKYNIICIEPVFKPADYLRKSLRSKLFKELFTYGEVKSDRKSLEKQLLKDRMVDFDGFPVPGGFYNEVLELQEKFGPHSEGFTNKCKVIWIKQRNGRKDETEKEYIERTVIMGAFWNLTDSVDPSQLIELIREFFYE